MVIRENKYVILFTAVALITIVLDQFAKYLISATKSELNLGFLSIHFVQNTGAGFGILKGQMAILAVISAVVLMGIIYYYNKIPQEWLAQALFGLFLGGVAGNLIDRIYRQYEVDFIDVGL